MSGFQTTINQQPAPAVEGDFASANPRAHVLAGDSALIADPAGSGVVVGRFAWVDSTGQKVNNNGTGVPRGFVSRKLQATITAILGVAGQYSMVILPGFPVTLFNQGDFWARTANPATIGQKVFASLLDGSVSTAAAGSTIAAASVTASFATNVMTVSAVGSGTLVVGQEITGTSIPAGTYIAALGTGSGGTGTYTLNNTVGTIGSETVTAIASVETPFKVDSVGAANELIKISTWG